MIDEVEIVMPEAVSMHCDGYKRVDYGMLGISWRINNPGEQTVLCDSSELFLVFGEIAVFVAYALIRETGS